MTYVDSYECEELRVILCMEFQSHAPPDEVSDLKAALIDCPNTLQSMETTGAFDFVVEVAPPDMAWFNKWLKSFAAPLAKLVNQCEKSFICKRFIRRSKNERALWVPSEDGLKCIDCSAVDKIIADGDYVQVHSDGQKWLLHATMHALLGTLSSREFVQLHRSIIVRCAFIERLTHRGRQWTAHLRDGSIERIARSHVAEVLEATHLANAQPHSSNVIDFDEAMSLRLPKT